MDNELNKQLEETTDENLILTKLLVDKYIIQFEMKLDIDERNELIIKIYKLIIKKYLASSNAKFEENKEAAISQIVKSYLARKLNKDRKDLENTN